MANPDCPQCHGTNEVLRYALFPQPDPDPALVPCPFCQPLPDDGGPDPDQEDHRFPRRRGLRIRLQADPKISLLTATNGPHPKR